MASTAGLQEPFKSQVESLLKAGGGAITLTSGYRSTAEQYSLRSQHGCRGREYDPSCKGNPITALPGQSPHNRGLAVDLGGNTALAERLASQFGMRRTVASEAWHFEPTTSSSGIATTPAGSSGTATVGFDPLCAINPLCLASSAVERATSFVVSSSYRVGAYAVLLIGAVALVVVGGIRLVAPNTKLSTVGKAAMVIGG